MEGESPQSINPFRSEKTLPSTPANSPITPKKVSIIKKAPKLAELAGGASQCTSFRRSIAGIRQTSFVQGQVDDIETPVGAPKVLQLGQAQQGSSANLQGSSVRA